MSEKTVNIKITASTKDFSNAIDKAQKQIEGLAESIDNLGSSKFGDKLEEQLDSLLKALKKAEEQISDMQKSLEDLSKNKFDKLEDQFKDIIDSGKDVNEKVEDILDLLDKVDKQDLNGLEKEFDQIKNALENIKKETNDSTDTMEKNFRDVADEVDKFIKELNNIEDTKLENLEESVKDLDKYIDEAAESVSDFNKKTDDLDDKELNEYLNTLSNVTRESDNVRDSLKKAFGSLNGQNSEIGINISGKDKGSIVSDLAGELLGATVVGNKLEKAMEGIADSIDDVAKSMDKIDNDTLDTKSIDEWGEEYKEAKKSISELSEEIEEHTKAVEEASKAQAEAKKIVEQYAKEEKKLVDAYDEANDAHKKQLSAIDKVTEEIQKSKAAEEELKESIRKTTDEADRQQKEVLNLADSYYKQEKVLEDLRKEYEDLDKVMKATRFDGDEDGFYRWIDLQEEIEQTEKKLREIEEVWDDAYDNSNFNELREEVAKLNEELSEQEKKTKDLQGVYDVLSDGLGNLKNNVDKARRAYEDWQDNSDEYTWAQISENLERMNKAMAENKISEASKQMEHHQAIVDEATKAIQSQVDEFDNQYKAYDKLSQRVKKYLEDEENGILLREKVAKSFRDVSNSMEAVYKDASKLNNADLIDKTLLEAAEHLKELNLVSTENLQKDLERLGEIIEDKTDKIKRFKEMNKEFGSDASKQAYGIEQQAQAIRDWANKADFAIEAAETLTNAWGDLSAAGEDHQKIRERTKYVEDFGKALEKNVAQIRNNYKELETLDEIYEKCTDKERGILEDYKMWEKNKDALLEYNRAINEYMRTVKDSGGQIDSKFLDELGNFNVQKFIDNFEKMGASSIVLSKQINAVKIELLENIKQYKENAEAARENAEQSVRNAEAAVEEAKANQKAAKSQEERKEATEKLKKAKEDLINATKKLDNVDNETLEGIKDQIKEYNRLAEAMREIGMAAQDLGKADIEKFNRSLAAMLDNIDTFENDLPKTFEDIKEDINALFTNMEGFDLGGIWDGLKDIGSGVLDMIPDKLKAAATQAGLLAAALKKCAEWGVDQFSQGLDTVKSALSGLVGLARDIGQEIGDAFSNITGMELDLSSLMEIPVNFESQMAKVGAIAGVDKLSEDSKKLEEEARRLGATTRYSATEVGEAMEYMAMAGWGFEDIMRKSSSGVTALESVLSLATVASMDLGQASDFVTDGLTALGYEADSAAKFVDILAAASTSSNTSVAQMQRAFTNCAPVAGTLGITMEDLSLALGLMADKGVKGAKAGTALKNLMANLSAPTEKQLAYIKKFNLEGAQQAIVAGDLAGGIKQFKAALAGLSPQQQNAIITTIAGKEALSGVSALLNTTEEDLAELESAIKNCDGAATEMAENFDNTLEGALKGLASAMQETILQLRDMTKEAEDSIVNIINDIADFFHILNGFKESSSGLTGLAGAFEHLEETTRRWGDAIAEGLEKAIGAIDNFINGPIFDDILQAGTNIINGIAEGIQRAADNGTLQSAITGAIRKIGTWFADNLETVIEVGREIIDAISKGIEENSDVIGRVIIDVIEMQNEIDNAIAYEKWKLIGANLATFIIQGFQSKAKELFSGIGGFLTGLFTGNGGIERDPDDPSNFTYTDPVSGKTYGPGVKNGKDYGDGVKDGIGSKKEDIGNTINQNFADAKVKTDSTAASIGQGISDNIVKKLETMDTGDLAALREEMLSLGKTVDSVGNAMATSFTTIQNSARTSFTGLANIVRNQMVNCTNIIRNQMVNMANIISNQTLNARNALTTQFLSMASVVRTQMVNISNIVRNQAITWANIIRNQVTSARNALTSQFLSMASVARTQMVNISNIIRNQAVTWANIIANQVKNARDALTSQFISMAKVAATQMNKVVSSVRTSMNQVATATSRGISVNVSGGVTAPPASALSANAIYAANNASLASLAGNTSALYNNASYATSASGSSSSGNSSGGNNMVIEVPLYLDGKKVAQATARYMDGEIKTMNNRENRKRGAK